DQLPNGAIDLSFRGRAVQRGTTAAELSITTGLRLQEWRTLLQPELIPTDGGGASVVLESTTKGQRRRTVYGPSKTTDDISLYVNTERKRVVRNPQKWLARHIDGLAVVDNIQIGRT